MTFNSNRKAALAVTAGLVGALTLGGAAVVAPAYADDAALTSVQPSATITATNGMGQTVKVEKGKTVELKAGSRQYLKINLQDGQTAKYFESDGSPMMGAEAVTDANAEAAFDATRRDAAPSAGYTDMGDYIAKTRTNDGHVYVVKVYDANGTEVASAQFKYVKAEVTYTAYNKKDGSSTFTYDHTPVQVGLVDQDGNKTNLPSSAKFYDQDGNKTAGNGSAPVYAGTYTAKWQESNGEYKSVTVTVEKLDLSKVVLTMGDQKTGTAPVDGDAFLAANTASGSLTLKDVATVTKVTNPKGNTTFGQSAGKYTVEIAPISTQVPGGININELKASVTGTGTLTYYVVDGFVPGAAQYGVVAGENYTVNQAEGQAFDASKVKFVATDGTVYSGDQIEVTYSKSGKAVDASELSKKGNYVVTVRVKPFQSYEQLLGGSDTFNVNVATASINADQGVTFTKDGQVVADPTTSSNPGVTVAYDGSDVLKSISTKVADIDGKVYEAGKDYKVVVTEQGAPAKELDSIVDAGTYTVEVVPVTFDKTTVPGDWDLTVVVNPVSIKDDGSNYGLADQTVYYNGSDLAVPAVKYLVRNADGSVKLDSDKKPVYAELPSDLYAVASIKDQNSKTVESMKDAGDYTVRIALTDAAKSNYSLLDQEFKVTVKKAKSFADVDATAWYAKGVEKAYENWYVNGIAGTDLFAPMANITRADAVCVLFNMAGGSKLHNDPEFSYDENTGYITGFSDVNGKAYYAKALAWAKASGVATGYGDGTFKPDAKITREEFAALLVKYAKSKGDYKAPEGDALAGVSDASTVSAWAEGAVNWAVSNKVMGNGGFVAGQSSITRAEVATMAVNYQPKPLYNVDHRA